MSMESSKVSTRREMGLDEFLRKMKLSGECDEVVLAREEKKSLPVVPPQYVSSRDKKRMKRVVVKEAVTSPTKNKAASRKEDHRSQ